GTYRINESRTLPLRLGLTFDNGELNLYTSSLKYLEGNLDDIYDWKADVLSDHWNPKEAIKKLVRQPDTLVTDALLDQQIFAGVGNIIKNEVLYRTRVHPKSILRHLPLDKLLEQVEEARNYSFDFLKWKKAFVLRKHWLVYK